MGNGNACLWYEFSKSLGALFNGLHAVVNPENLTFTEQFAPN
jgi:hypothetical protein